jgi:hypothetical protein
VSRPSNRRARGKAARDSGEPRANLYDEVTRRIIAELEKGRFPWVQPWGSKAGSAGVADWLLAHRPCPEQGRGGEAGEAQAQERIAA